jgi:hypothetical protein
MKLFRESKFVRGLKSDAVGTFAAISFSLTFVGMSLALLTGLFPERLLSLTGSIDTGVVLLFVPLCALVLAIVAEVFRTSMYGVLRSNVRRTIRPLSRPRTDHAEG